MELFTPIPHESANSLGVAIVLSSSTPLLLLDAEMVVQAASGSFCSCFGLDSATVIGTRLLDLGKGEWNLPRLQSLLTATASGNALIEAYEIDLVRAGKETARLVINALKHAFPDSVKKGTITVTYASTGDGWLLGVNDDGVGMAAGGAKPVAGLGTGIVDALSKQLGAKVTVLDGNPGTRVRVTGA